MRTTKEIRTSMRYWQSSIDRETKYISTSKPGMPFALYCERLRRNARIESTLLECELEETKAKAKGQTTLCSLEDGS